MNNIELEKKIKQLVHSMRYNKGYVCVVDILIGLDYLSTKDYENWRFGKIDYLEKVCKINLSKLTLINKLIRKFAIELQLEKSWTGYNKFGKGPSQRLIFSKSCDEKIEIAYATHYIDKERLIELKINKACV